MTQRQVGPQDATTGELRLELAARLSEIARLVEAFKAFASGLRLPAADVYQVTLALDELVTNIVAHGVGPDRQKPIVVELSYAAGVLTTVISDAGQPFDPRTIAAPDFDKPLQDRKIGGLGLHIVRSFMDSLDYRYEDGRNRLTLVKQMGEPVE